MAMPAFSPSFLLFPQRKISLLGSTGSIGTQTLDIVTERSDIYEVTALAAGREGGKERGRQGGGVTALTAGREEGRREGENGGGKSNSRDR